MGDPIGLSSFEHCVILACRHRDGESPCNIPLPRQSPLGIYEGQHYRTTGEWPATFLCLRHGLSFACSPHNIRLEVEMMGLNHSVPQLWRIECECAHENCGKPHSIYTARAPDWTTIVARILKTNPIVPCGDHSVFWQKDLMHGIEFAH